MHEVAVIRAFLRRSSIDQIVIAIFHPTLIASASRRAFPSLLRSLQSLNKQDHKHARPSTVFPSHSSSGVCLPCRADKKEQRARSSANVFVRQHNRPDGGAYCREGPERRFDPGPHRIREQTDRRTPQQAIEWRCRPGVRRHPVREQKSEGESRWPMVTPEPGGSFSSRFVRRMSHRLRMLRGSAHPASPISSSLTLRSRTGTGSRW